MEKTAYTQEQAVQYDALRFRSDYGERIHARELEGLLGFLEKSSPAGAVLEVGCGTGRLLVEVADAGYQVEGLDASEHMLSQLKEKLGSRDVPLHLSPAAMIPQPDAHYSATYSIRLFNQLESPEYGLNVVREMIRVTKPGANILVEFCSWYRPRIPGLAIKQMRIRPGRIIKCAEESGAEVLKCSGMFFLGMTAYKWFRGPLLPLVDKLDRVLSYFLPRLCSRCYVMLQKKD